MNLVPHIDALRKRGSICIPPPNTSKKSFPHVIRIRLLSYNTYVDAESQSTPGTDERGRTKGKRKTIQVRTITTSTRVIHVFGEETLH